MPSVPSQAGLRAPGAGTSNRYKTGFAKFVHAGCMSRNIATIALLPLLLSFSCLPAQVTKSKKVQASTASQPHGYDYEHPEVQPAVEALDLDMYARIRKEGLDHSHIMEYASGLFDGIGPRLTGSPNMAKANAWTRDQLTAMGCANAKLESWGEFGMGWRQISTSVDMATPDTAVLIAQATPWSPATAGSVTAEVIAVPYPQDENDLAPWKGKLAGKIILFGKPPVVPPDPEPLLQHYDEAKLRTIYQYPLDGDFKEQHV